MGRRRSTGPADDKAESKPPGNAPSAPAGDSTAPSTPAAPRTPGGGFAIVGIGASAGGLEALEELFREMPADSGCAFVVVTHLHAGQTSRLAEILARNTPIDVTEAVDGVRLAPNHIYVATPGSLLALRNGVLRRMEAAEPQLPRLPIDYFLRSLATDQRENGIGIVLSGTGSDGALGLKAVKAEDGLTLVQAPQTAGYSGMPGSAIALGVADFVLAPGEMGAKLVASARGERPERPPAPPPQEPAETLKEILTLLLERTGHDFSDYKPGTLGRRIERRMRVHHLRDSADYLRLLRSSPAEPELLLKDLLIGVTSFFRDPEAFSALGERLIRDLKSHPAREPYRVWIAGCATGEEAYSVAILLREALQQLDRQIEVQIFATDLDAGAVDHARDGLYPDGIAADVSPERLEQWFRRDDSRYRVRKDLRDMVLFAEHDLTRDPPFSKLDLLCCRNVLIYLNVDLQQRLLQIFHYGLKPGGLLFLGSAEHLGGCSPLFESADAHWRLFRRKEVAVDMHPLFHFPTGLPPGLSKTPETAQRVTAVAVDRLLLSQFAPASVIVNDHGDILHFYGRTGDYLELPAGRPRMNVLEMAREGLRTEISGALRQVTPQHPRVVREGASVPLNGVELPVTLTVLLIQEPAPLRNLLLVSFQPQPARTTAAVRSPKRGREPELELELRRTRERLQAMVEELETSNEELRSANEELQSINEELQSSNEELRTSREELQALNEELSTVNSELQAKIREVQDVNADMQNLLNSTDIATISLDDQLQIKRYTEQAKTLAPLLSTDIGRPLSDFRFQLEYDGITRDCSEVRETGAPLERQVRASDGVWRLMRIIPYVTAEGRVSGLVLTFVNIDLLKQAEQKQLEREEQLRSIVNTATDAIITIDRQGIVRSFNPAAERMFGYALQEAVGQNVKQLMPSPYRDEHDGYIARYLATGEPRVIGVGREAVGQRKDGSLFPIDLAVSEVDHLGMFAGVIRDITQRKTMEEELLRIAGEEQQRIGQDLHDHTSQELTALLLTADTLLEDFDEGRPADIQLLRKLRNGLQEAASQVRMYSRGLIPVEVDAEGLRAALAELAKNTTRLHKVDCRFDWTETPPIGSNAVATHLYRIAQEAVMNAVRHANPRHIQIALQPSDGGVVLRIRDDGQGLGQTPPDSAGMGLRIMSHRASLIQGQLVVEPGPEGGTEVRCTVVRREVQDG